MPYLLLYDLFISYVLLVVPGEGIYNGLWGISGRAIETNEYLTPNLTELVF